MQIKNTANSTEDAVITILRGLITSKPMTGQRKTDLQGLVQQLSRRHPEGAPENSCYRCGKVKQNVPWTSRRQMAYNDILKEIDGMQGI